MKKALLITIVYPPEETGGSIRVTKLAKYLALEGWQSIILTARPPFKTEQRAPLFAREIYRAPRADITAWLVRLKAFLRGKQAKTNLKRLSHKSSPVAENGKSRRLSDWVLIPDDRILWVPGAVLVGFWAILKESPDVLFSTSPNPTALIVGYCLHRLTRIPWVIEFRDPWISNPFCMPRPMRWMNRFEAWLERTICSASNHIVVTSEQYKLDLLERCHVLSEERITYIPNGFDPEDFQSVKPMNFNKFTILHAGSFYGSRSAKPFLMGLNKFISNDPSIREKLQALLVGEHDPESERVIRELGLEEVVQQTGKVTHSRMVELMLGADILLLVPGPGAGTTPGKLFEYMAARKPILGLCEAGFAQTLLSTSAIGVVAKPDDIEAISNALAGMYAKICAAEFNMPKTDSLLRNFDRREIARKMAHQFDQVSTKSA